MLSELAWGERLVGLDPGATHSEVKIHADGGLAVGRDFSLIESDRGFSLFEFLPTGVSR